ncbi:metallopeptidase TldD-related protein [Granulicella tundricola]|uniref:Peptidase U62 modulator of DNA gyrase n=1 Tax=Granulicella tundricola (strain ATCC BAA-1859 / DSM 23138 / MP5ACTX9) TaxID=1198114 RepID=E8WZV1_GRATM|nr:metallopeptidase TldD-related protein [Granulicella tundricola]ADW67762.1 peptidase U62 modulator of DNA gyrase [Granulicella tundricola MP5ACTX9]
MRALRIATSSLLGFALTAFAQGAEPKPAAPIDFTAAEHTAAADPLLTAMLAELQREQQLLILPGMQRPYFMEYRLDDFASYEAVANYGAVSREQRGHQRIVRVSVRIGDYASDSSTSRGDGTVELAPRDNDPQALHYALWTATDEAYKGALRAYAAKQAALKRFEKAPTAEDFSRIPAVQRIEPLVSLSLDEAAWNKRIAEASGLFLTDPALAAAAPHVQYSSADVRGLAVNRYLVNTEGTVFRHGYASYGANYNVGGQADDGMSLSRANGTAAAKADELESAAAFHKRVVDDVLSYEALRNAPVADAEDFHGPVLFSGDASADVLSRLFLPNVEADRPEMGTTARTVGAYQSSFRARVLPDVLDVTDNPLEATFAGKSLIGAYAIDDEGVPAKPVELVEKGKLENYLIGRTPVRDFPISNGHGRAAPGQPAHSRAGVMIFKSTSPISSAELHQKLIGMAKEQGRDVYEVETMGGELAPRLLYRVHPDGTRQLVRGAIFDELDNRSLRSDIVAAGGDPYVDNMTGPIPETIIAPSLLFGDIGVKRASEEQQKLPYYAPPK